MPIRHQTGSRHQIMGKCHYSPVFSADFARFLTEGTKKEHEPHYLRSNICPHPHSWLFSKLLIVCGPVGQIQPVLPFYRLLFEHGHAQASKLSS